MKTRIALVLLGIVAIASLSFGQILPDSSQLAALKDLYSRYDSSFAVHWDEKNGTADIITLGKPRSFALDPVVSAQTFLQEIQGLLKKRYVVDELQVQQSQTNDGIRYVRFKQYYKGVPVGGGEYVVTLLPGRKVQSALGGFYKDIHVDVTPKLSAQQALSVARQNRPANVELKDSLKASQLVVYPKDGAYHLAWELRPANATGFGEWVYIVDASDGTILNRYNEVMHEISSSNLIPLPQANVYLHHPYIDASYTLVSPINVDYSGYLQGTYANVVNDATARAYSSINDFAYSPSDTHFDEANLFYHIDNFRRNYWNGLGFSAFT